MYQLTFHMGTRMAEILPPLRETPSSKAMQSDRIDSLKNMAMAVYILNLLAFFNGVTAIFGVVIAYVKRGDAGPSVFASHFSDQIRVFWITVVVGAIGWITSWILIGFVVWFFLAIWYGYRNIMGLLRLAGNRPA